MCRCKIGIPDLLFSHSVAAVDFSIAGLPTLLNAQHIKLGLAAMEKAFIFSIFASSEKDGLKRRYLN